MLAIVEFADGSTYMSLSAVRISSFTLNSAWPQDSVEMNSSTIASDLFLADATSARLRADGLLFCGWHRLASTIAIGAQWHPKDHHQSGTSKVCRSHQSQESLYF